MGINGTYSFFIDELFRYYGQVPAVVEADSSDEQEMRDRSIGMFYDPDTMTVVCRKGLRNAELLFLHECGHHYTWEWVKYDTYSQEVYAEACAHLWAYYFAYTKGWFGMQEEFKDFLQTRLEGKKGLYYDAAKMALKYIEEGNTPAFFKTALKRGERRGEYV